MCSSSFLPLCDWSCGPPWGRLPFAVSLYIVGNSPWSKSSALMGRKKSDACLMYESHSCDALSDGGKKD